MFLPSKEPRHGKKTVNECNHDSQPGEIDMPGEGDVSFPLHDHKPERRSADEAEEQDTPCNYDHWKG